MPPINQTRKSKDKRTWLVKKMVGKSITGFLVVCED
jgi:hypothetical protein